MVRARRNTLHVLLAEGRTDKERIDTVLGILQMAPQSALYLQNPQIHAAIDAMSPLATALKTKGEAANGLQLQLDALREDINGTRIKYGRALGILRSNLEAAATTVADVATLGIVARLGAPPVPALTPPTGVKIVLGKKHGQFTATAVSPLKGVFGAQVSPDPVGPATWVDVTGTGKRRVVSGHPTGTLLWIRFRRVTGKGASDWCAPVPVTVP